MSVVLLATVYVVTRTMAVGRTMFGPENTTASAEVVPAEAAWVIGVTSIQ